VYITYITGCDSKYFLMTGILLQAFKKHCPGHTLHVCDFGLEPFQKKILSASGILLEKPPDLQSNQHPWIYKSSLIRYLNHAAIAPDIIVWIDSDCFPVGPFTREIEKITAGWEEKANIVALCRGKVGKNWQLASPPGNIQYFNMQPDYPYYNSGMWILRSDSVLNEWAEEIDNVPKGGMYEQDTFNYLLFKHSTYIQKLENNRWNVTHDSLEKVKIDPNGKLVLDGEKVLIIHITGDYTLLKVTAGPFNGFIRAVKKSELKQLQMQLLRKWYASIHSKNSFIPSNGTDKEG